MKIKVKAKNRKDKAKEFLLEKECNNWLNKNENKTVLNDYMELINNCLMFRMKWGIPTEIVIGEIEEQKGRQLGDNINK